MSIIRNPQPALFETAQRIQTPALLYDLDGIAHTVAELRRDLTGVAPWVLCFAVKATRCPAVLRHLASLGLGADVATLAELEAAAAAGLSPIFATSPALTASDMGAMIRRGAHVDLDSLSQLRVWAESWPGARDIGLRLRVTPARSERTEGEPSAFSRFGIHAADRTLLPLLSAHGLRVTRLHVHAGELESPARTVAILDVLSAALDLFPEVDLVNLGGGLSQLYSDRDKARATWDLVRAWLGRAGRPLKLVLEPGMLLTGLSGYLVADVVAAGEGNAGRRLVTLNASAWNLISWSVPRVVAPGPAPAGEGVFHDLAGCTCYERDYFVREAYLRVLDVGDRVVLSGAGAYASSMARATHGVDIPREWVFDERGIRAAKELA